MYLFMMALMAALEVSLKLLLAWLAYTFAIWVGAPEWVMIAMIAIAVTYMTISKR